jgi:GH15 family glucan-1,4-alpha-glucosidase
MPRDIPVGNGSLLVNFDDRYQLRDLYWPHVGQENHTDGHPFRFGVWVDGQFRWVSDDIENVPGNPWFICTLWLAQWHIAKARSFRDLKPALDILDWVADHDLRSGVMAEQVHPYTNEPLSVSPLTWSHATLVMTVQEYLAKRAHLNRCPECGQPIPGTVAEQDLDL